MKEYKFRGFDAIGQKGWVYGDLVHNKKVTKTGLEDRVMVGGYEVVPESVGLSTGKMDSKGAEIFEGDIIQVLFEGNVLFEAPVIWHKRLAGFYLDEGNMCFSPLPDMRSMYVVCTKYENNNE